jgi:CheY-like chemotaxis protein
MPLTLVLSVGQDSSLLMTRNLVLETAGYTVVPSLSIKEAFNRFMAGDFDLVILDYSLPAKDRERLASLIRATSLRTPVVSVVQVSGWNDPYVDTTVESEPEMLLIGVREALLKAANPMFTYRERKQTRAAFERVDSRS